MNKPFNQLILFLSLIFSGAVTAEDFAIEDQGVGMSVTELEVLVAAWTPDMREAALNDRGDLLELLNIMLAAKKIAEQAKNFTEEDDPVRYWQQQLRIRNINRQFVTNNYMRDLAIPDMEELARERYVTQKDEYAAIPEERTSSHILWMCQRPECEPDEIRPEADKVLAELRAGADFEEMVQRYSDDETTKQIGGKYDKWLVKGRMSNTAPQYHQAVFEIEGVGAYSEVTLTGYGWHIIRLDDLREKTYRPYEEVEASIKADLVKEYKELAAKDFDSRYQLTPEVVIDEEALDAIFAPYRASDAQAP